MIFKPRHGIVELSLERLVTAWRNALSLALVSDSASSKLLVVARSCHSAPCLIKIRRHEQPIGCGRGHLSGLLELKLNLPCRVPPRRPVSKVNILSMLVATVSM
jgi:hypothetical protein